MSIFIKILSNKIFKLKRINYLMENNNEKKEKENDNNLLKEKDDKNKIEASNINEEEKPKLTISKSQMKKIKKQEEWKKKMEEIKKYKKEKKKEKKRIKKEQKELEEKLNPKNKEEEKKNKNSDVPFKTKKQLKEEFKEKCKNGVRVIIDCDFEHLMNDRGNKSMVRQIIDLYGINRSSSNPFRLILYGVGDKIREGLKKCSYENWLGVEIFNKDQYPNFDTFIKEILYKEDKRDLKDIKNDIYYLSADSENNIETIDNNATYIIGGIVDRNKYKGLSLNKAKELGINHGKFPIGDYLKLHSSQVLTTNHTFHILNEFSIKHDWKEAFTSIIPKRKQDNEEEEEKEDDEKED
jgi:tRNA (guanine9-N1)-methyltransferase